ncbi:MAG TPA: division/cell wall cluster transcriptional repressor MraZ, partial [Crenotrichaceae bacterium]|nr:division/cell wall cluster transcriptional repressor MraZ [Crenotrichaceae bacterium]
KPMEKILDNAPNLNRRTNRFKRRLIGNAAECEMDGQGRILIPEELRSYAGFKKSLALIGMVSKFEIWDSEQWDIGVAESENEEVDDLSDVPGLEDFTF